MDYERVVSTSTGNQGNHVSDLIKQKSKDDVIQVHSTNKCYTEEQVIAFLHITPIIINQTEECMRIFH